MVDGPSDRAALMEVYAEGKWEEMQIFPAILATLQYRFTLALRTYDSIQYPSYHPPFE